MPKTPAKNFAAPLPLHAAMAKAIAGYLAARLPPGIRAAYPIRRELDRSEVEPPVIVVAANDDGPDLSGVEPRRLSVEVRVVSASSGDPDDHLAACRAVEVALAAPDTIRAALNAGSARPVHDLHVYFLDADVTRHERRDEIDETIIALTAIAEPAALE